MDTKLIGADAFLALLDEDGEAPEGATVVQSGDWVVEFKNYANKETIYKFGEQFFCVIENRSGDYYSDYDYGESTCCEVKPQEVTVTHYVAI